MASNELSSSAANGRFVFDQFMDQPDKLPQEVQFEKLRAFVASSISQLQAAESSLEEPSFGVWSASSDVVGIDLAPSSRASVEEVIESCRDNKLYFKLMLTFSVVANELCELCEEAKTRIIPPLIVFGEQPDGKDLQDGEVQLCFGRILPLLMDAWNFSERMYTVIQNLIRQMASLYSAKYKKRSQLSAYQSVHFQPVWMALSEALGVLISIDELICQNEAFVDSATVYKRMMRNVRSAPEKYDTDLSSAKRFEYLIQKLEGDLMYDVIFQNCISRQFENQANEIFVKDNTVFMAEFGKAVTIHLEYVSRALNTPFETNKREQLIGCCGLFAMFCFLFREKLRRTGDHKRIFRSLWETQKKVPVVHIGGTTSFVAMDWLARRVPDLVSSAVKDIPKEIAACKSNAFASLDATFEATIVSLSTSVAVWASRFESGWEVSDDGEAMVRVRIALMVQGIQYAYELRHLFRTILLLHLQLDNPLSVHKVLLICKCVETLKNIETSFHRVNGMTGNLISAMLAYVSGNISKALVPLQTKLKENQRKIDDAQIDQLSSLELMLNILKAPPTQARLRTLKIALSIALQKSSSGVIQESDFDSTRQNLRVLDLLADHQRLVKQACDCNILFWFRMLVQIYFRNVCRNPELVESLPALVSALHDVIPILTSAQHLSDHKSLVNAYISEMKEYMNDEVISPVQKEIENELRLHIHSVILGQDSRDLKQVTSQRNFIKFVQLPPLQFFGEQLYLRECIRHYLDTQFYNLCALSPHDWKTYEELRSLTREKYGISLAEVHLPGATLEQGLDVLEITRNIHLFVSRYTYNLNNQMFVENPQQTSSKSLHTIHIRHIANSIRTHGTGIMNTTINCVYQFLGKKFYQFSQFLFDDHIKSRLMKDFRQFLEAKDELKGMYPVKKAELFVRDIRKLGSAEDGASFLDHFRELITEIGNALGYVRMVRSGGLRYISESIKFVPDLTNIVKFGELSEAAKLDECALTAGRNLDSVLSDLSEKFSKGSDYFGMLQSVFTEEMHKEKNQHLKNFFVIVPPLTSTFIEHIITSKEKVTKKGKTASFTDDGFALGVAFILKLLKQTRDFDSLHWFSSVDEYYKSYANDLKNDMDEKRRTKAKDKAEAEITTMKLTSGKIETARREFELLYFAFRSSRVFFSDRSGEGRAEECEPDFDFESDDR